MKKKFSVKNLNLRKKSREDLNMNINLRKEEKANRSVLRMNLKIHWWNKWIIW